MKPLIKKLFLLFMAFAVTCFTINAQTKWTVSGKSIQTKATLTNVVTRNVDDVEKAIRANNPEKDSFYSRGTMCRANFLTPVLASSKGLTTRGIVTVTFKQGFFTQYVVTARCNLVTVNNTKSNFSETYNPALYFPVKEKKEQEVLILPDEMAIRTLNALADYMNNLINNISAGISSKKTKIRNKAMREPTERQKAKANKKKEKPERIKLSDSQPPLEEPSLASAEEPATETVTEQVIPPAEKEGTETAPEEPTE